MVKLSVLDLSPIATNMTAHDALMRSAKLAQHCEALGYERFWMVEQHNLIGVASSTPSIVLGYIGSQTNTIRLGVGGMLVPNHAPIQIAEQMGTLASLFPDRVDLGLGRSAGADPETAKALRRGLDTAASYPQDIEEILHYFSTPLSDALGSKEVRAFPGQGMNIPVWILGSTLNGAQFAARLGLPYAYASHFSPDHLEAALKTYRDNFKPSQYLSEPYVMVGMNVFAGQTKEHAHQVQSSMLQKLIALEQGKPGKLVAPTADLANQYSGLWYEAAQHALSYSAVGTKEQVQQDIRAVAEKTQAQEIILTCSAYHTEDMFYSFTAAADTFR